MKKCEKFQPGELKTLVCVIRSQFECLLNICRRVKLCDWPCLYLFNLFTVLLSHLLLPSLSGVSQVSLLVLEFLLGFLAGFDIFYFARVAIVVYSLETIKTSLTHAGSSIKLILK